MNELKHDFVIQYLNMQYLNIQYLNITHAFLVKQNKQYIEVKILVDNFKKQIGFKQHIGDEQDGKMQRILLSVSCTHGRMEAEGGDDS